MNFRSRIGWNLARIYFGLYVFSGIYAICFLVFGKPRPEFNPPSIVTLPWSIMLIIYSHKQGILDWYSRHTGDPILYGTVMTLVVLPAALLNAFLLYWFGKLLEGPHRS
jgi:hypothetical protein